jgi:4-hydroxybenzoyl-CoA reductase subunit beta
LPWRKVELRLPQFSYVEAQSVRHASETIAASDALVLAGGTDLLVSLKQKLLRPDTLLDIKKIAGLNFIRELADGAIGIGALTTLSGIERSALIKERLPALAGAARSVATPQIRNKATLGGNICLNTRCWYYNMPVFSRGARAVCSKLGGDVCHVAPGGKQGRCHSLFSADTVPVLMVLDADVKLCSAAGSRTVPLPKIYSGDGRAPISLRRGEVASEVLIPSPRVRTYSCYLKLRERGTLDFPILGVAAAVTFHEDNATCSRARIALTGVSSEPVAAPEAEAFLKDRLLNRPNIAEAANLVRDRTPVHSLNGVPAKYKREMISAYAGRALAQLQRAAAETDRRT